MLCLLIQRDLPIPHKKTELEKQAPHTRVVDELLEKIN